MILAFYREGKLPLDGAKRANIVNASAGGSNYF
jgi:hypothetical protein